MARNARWGQQREGCPEGVGWRWREADGWSQVKTIERKEISMVKAGSSMVQR